MRKNDTLREFFTSDEMDKIYEEAKQMEEDIILLNLMASRLKTTSIDFKVVPTKKSSIHQKFLTEMYLNMYDFNGVTFLEIYYAAVKCFEEFYKETYDEELISKIILELYNYDVSLLKYSSCFIGCSRLSMKAGSVIHSILEKNKKID